MGSLGVSDTAAPTHHLFLESLKKHGLKNGAGGLQCDRGCGLGLGDGKGQASPSIIHSARWRTGLRGRAWGASWRGRQKTWPGGAKRSWNYSSHGLGFLKLAASQLDGRRDWRGKEWE